MENVKNQYGFATLEIVMVVAIVAVLSTVAVPKMARTLDKVFLDYETKNLYSELNFARSIGKSSTFEGSLFAVEDSKHKTEIWIYGQNYPTNSVKNRHIIKRTSVTRENFYIHNLTNDIKLTFNKGNEILKISFDNPSRYSSFSNTLTLTSKFNRQSKIIFDSVGRWHCEH